MKTILTSVLLFSLAISLSFMNRPNDLKLGQQAAFYTCSDTMKINDLVHVRIKGQLYFQTSEQLDSIGITNVKSSWRTYSDSTHRTIYIVNSTDSLIKVTRQDGSLLMIQEALDVNGEWMPIEYWTPSGCGNSYFNPLTLLPQHFIVYNAPLYSGDFKTKIRFKWKIGHQNIYYSHPIQARIDSSLFAFPAENVSGILFYGQPSYLD